MSDENTYRNRAEHIGSDRIRNALSWCKDGDRIALEYFQEISADRKSDRTMVTRADREIEQMLRDQIQACYPEDTIVGEEFSDRPGGKY